MVYLTSFLLKPRGHIWIQRKGNLSLLMNFRYLTDGPGDEEMSKVIWHLSQVVRIRPLFFFATMPNESQEAESHS